MIIDPKFQIREEVKLKHDSDKHKRLVIGYIISETELLYRLACGTEISSHYDYEITHYEDVSLAKIGFGKTDSQFISSTIN